MKRSTYIDAIKCLAIILVVLGHCIQFGSGANYIQTEGFFSNSIFKFIYAFHMPLFMLISGFLFGKSACYKDDCELFISRVKSLLIPLVSWNTVFYCLDILTKGGALNSVNLPKYLYTILTGSWFIWSIILCTIIILLVRRVFNDSAAIYLVLIILSLGIPNLLLSNLHVYMFPYYLIGYKAGHDARLSKGFYAFSQKIRKNRKNQIVATLMTGGVFFVLLAGFERKHYIYTTGTFVLFDGFIQQLEINLFRWIVGLIGSIFAIGFVWLINENAMKNSLYCHWVRLLGGNTFGIYMVSSICNQLLKKITYNGSANVGIWIAETVIILSISLAATTLISHNRVLKKILLGGR